MLCNILNTYAASISINSYIFHEAFPDYSSLKTSFSSLISYIFFFAMQFFPPCTDYWLTEGKDLQALLFLPHGLEVHSKSLTNFS